MIAVTKLQRMLTSLVAAIPAGYLSYLLVAAMLSDSENLSTMAYVVMGGTLLSTVATLLIPVGILVLGNRKPPATMIAAKQGTGDEIESLDDDVEVSDGLSGSFDEQDVLAESSDFDLGDSNQDMLVHDSEDDVDTEPVEDFDLDEEVKPKKKRR